MVRLKNRYMLVNILYPELEKDHGDSKVPDLVAFNQPTTNKLNEEALKRAIRAQVVHLFGDFGAGAISDSLQIKYMSQATSTFILRVSRAHYKLAWAALSLMTSVPIKDGKRCVFSVVRVSGTIKKAEEEAIRRARELILKTRRTMGDEGDSTLDGMFGADKDKNNTRDDILMVDGSDSELDKDDG